MDKKQILKMIGQSLFFATVSVSFGSIEMNSKCSIRNTKDQFTLDSAYNSLFDYMRISIFWTISVSILLFSQYGIWGLITSLISNIFIMLWMYISYINCFKQAAKKYNLKVPKGNLFNWKCDVQD